MWRHNEARRWLVETGATMHRKISLGPLTVTKLMLDSKVNNRVIYFLK